MSRCTAVAALDVVFRAQFGAVHLAARNRDLMAQNQWFEVDSALGCGGLSGGSFPRGR